MMMKLTYMIMAIISCCLSCKIPQTHKLEISDCELISKIINQVGIIDEDYCYGFATIIPDTTANFKTSQKIFLNKNLSTYKLLNFSSCSNFDINNSKNIRVKPFKNIPVNSNSNINEPIYPFENDQCYEIYLSEINNYEDVYVIFIAINNGAYNYFIHFTFRLDNYKNIMNVNIINYEPNKSRPNYKDLSKKYPTLKSRKWEYYGLPDK